MHKGIELYFEQHVEPGSFMRFVLENNLMRAFGQADENNRRAMYHYCQWLYNYAPSGSYGSPEAVEKWLDRPEPIPRETRFTETQGNDL